jgi:hypothetical protein
LILAIDFSRLLGGGAPRMANRILVVQTSETAGKKRVDRLVES